MSLVLFPHASVVSRQMAHDRPSKRIMLNRNPEDLVYQGRLLGKSASIKFGHGVAGRGGKNAPLLPALAAIASKSSLV